MSLREWTVVLSLALLPAFSEEVTKFFLRRSDRRQVSPQQDGNSV